MINSIKIMDDIHKWFKKYKIYEFTLNVMKIIIHNFIRF